jgi:hypothetical protein
MTTQEIDSRDRRLVENIRFVLQVSPLLQAHADSLEISIENASVVLRGQLPRAELKAFLIPAVRQAGVLNRVDDYVRIAS